MKSIYDEARERILKDLFDGDIFPKAIDSLDENQRQKIRNHAERFGHSEEEVVSAVLENEVAYRIIVGKNPGRMDFYEDTLVEFLNNLPQVSVASKLPKSGPGAKYLSDGEIRTGGGRQNHVKSLDIYVQFANGANAYIIHKYTMEDGGAQDNQFREAMGTLSQIRKKPNLEKPNIIAVLDGAYYSKTRSNGLSRLHQAREEAPEAFICGYETFLEETRSIWDA